MRDDFETTFVVELDPEAVWEALTERTVEGAEAHPGDVHYVLAGFPSFPPLDIPGASCTRIEEKPGRLLRVRKDHMPCAGSEIAVQLESAGTGTRVTVVQSGFGPFLDIVGRDLVFGHGQQIARDLRLYIERRITVPGTRWGRNLGARTGETGVGLEVQEVQPGSFAQTAGLETGDLLLTLNGIRIHDTAQLMTVLALTETARPIEVTWARGRTPMRTEAEFTA